MKVNQKIVLFLGLFTLVQALYHPLMNSGFVTDFTGLLARFEGNNAWGILNSFDFPALQPVLNFFLYFFYKFFGTWGLAWYLIYSTFFTINGYLLFLLITQIGSQFHLPRSQLIAILASILYLSSPYQVEVLYWKVLFNFLSVTTYLFLALLFTLKYLKHEHSKHLWIIFSFYIIGLFTFELALTLPLLTLAYATIHYLEYRNTQKFKLLTYRLILPQFVIIAVWVLLTKWVVGNYIGHYGADVHLNFDIQQMAATFLKYLSKHLFFIRYLRISQNDFYAYLGQTEILISFFLLLFGIISSFLFKWKKLSSELKLSLLAFVWTSVALLPVLNIYFYTTLHIENDRYAYFAWAFLAWFLVLLMSKILPNKWIWLFFIPYLGLQIYFNQKTVKWAAQSTEGYNNLLQTFDYQEHSEIYLLGFADNLKGSYMFRDYTKSDLSFLDAYKYIERKNVKGKIYEVAQFNMVSPDDSLKATVDSTGRIHLTFNHWGSWWWKNGIGASSFETEHLKVEVKDLMLYITPKKPATDAIFLYQVGKNWMELEYPTNKEYTPIRPGPN